jgi:secreted PhoX family phosphatase
MASPLVSARRQDLEKERRILPVPMRRREFLKAGMTVAGAGALRLSVFERLFAAPAAPGPSPYGPLQPPDANGLKLPVGFTSRVIARSGMLVGLQPYVWPIFPDGAHCYPDVNGGWILVVNSETPSADAGAIPDEPQRLGGASAIRFNSKAKIIGAYQVLGGTRTNCAGGATPWGTWLSCEEFDDSLRGGPTSRAGKVWECDPRGVAPAVRRDALGAFKHEAAAVDPSNNNVYLTEDVGDGRFYRFRPASFTGGPADLNAGTLEAAAVSSGGAVTWLPIPDPSATSKQTRYQAPASTPFDGGEGCFYDSGIVYFTTKGDNKVWRYHVGSSTLDVLYDDNDPQNQPDPILTGVDNLIVSRSGDVFVAEDGGSMDIVMITPDNRVARFAKATGIQHGINSDSPVPTKSEITGLAFSPNGKRLYFNSQRGYALGITYEIRGPFRANA